MKARLITSGIALAALAGAALAQVPDPFTLKNYHAYFNDFDVYATGDWTLTGVEIGAGDTTEALTSVDGSALLITTAGNEDDGDAFQLVSEGFKYVAGKSMFCQIRFKASDVTQSDFVFGLQLTDTTPLDVTDGIFFLKADGAATVDFLVEKNNTATTSSAIATLANDTFVTLGFYYDGSSSDIKYLVNGTVVGASVLTNVPDDEELALSFAFQNGAAAAKTITIDYVGCYKQR
jgi:hypothetical protein